MSSEGTSPTHESPRLEGGVCGTDMQGPQFRDEVTVQLVRGEARDSDVIWAARVSTVGEESLETIDADPSRSEGLIRYLMKNRHGTPFEHNSMTFYIEAPIFVFREFQRHRIGWSYNEESGRYRQLKPVFYVPAPDRPLVQSGKPGHYVFEAGDTEQHALVSRITKRSVTAAYDSYVEMLEAGVAREVARGVLPVATYSSMYATCNARSLMAFLSLRVQSDEAMFPSAPQREIHLVASQMEAQFRQLMPRTHQAFVDAGRVAP